MLFILLQGFVVVIRIVDEGSKKQWKKHRWYKTML
jgi:hypothetical protein